MRVKQGKVFMQVGLVLLFGGGFVHGKLSEVEPGDARSVLLRKAGEPTGMMQTGQVTILVYPAGRVLLEEDRVKAVELRAESEVETEEMQMERLAKGEADRQRRDQSRIERGKLVKEQKLKDPGFVTLPAETRLSFWMQFSRLYPEVEVISLVQAAQDELKKEKKWDEYQSQVRYAGNLSSYSSGFRRVPGYYSYGGRHPYHRPVHLPAENEQRDSGIIQFENATLFTPDLPTLPSGPIR